MTKRKAVLVLMIMAAIVVIGVAAVKGRFIYEDMQVREQAEAGDATAQYRVCLKNMVDGNVPEAAKWAVKAKAQGLWCEDKIGDEKLAAQLRAEMEKIQRAAKQEKSK